MILPVMFVFRDKHGALDLANATTDFTSFDYELVKDAGGTIVGLYRKVELLTNKEVVAYMYHDRKLRRNKGQSGTGYKLVAPDEIYDLLHDLVAGTELTELVIID